MKRKTLLFVSLLMLVLFFNSCSSNGTHARLKNRNLDPEVKALCNEFVATYGIDSENYSVDSYAVFGFESLGFDIKAISASYQLNTLSFAILPENLRGVLLTDILNPNENLLRFGFFNGTISQLIDEICVLYEKLWNQFNGLSANGISEQEQTSLLENNNWKLFSEKMLLLYQIIQRTNVPSVSENWQLCWLTGMTENQIYQLSKKALLADGHLQLENNDFVKELSKCLNDNGIDVWFCVSLTTAQARAVIDLLGLHSSCSGLIARMNTLDESDHYTNLFDAQCNFGFYCNSDGTWTKMNRPTMAKPYTEGKVLSIMNAIFPDYHFAGPIASFVSSTQDYNLATEFDSLKFVMCFDDSTETEVAGIDVLTEVATFQKEQYGLSLSEVNQDGETYYFSFKTLENPKHLDEIRENNVLVQSAIDKYSTEFFRIYRGYHSVKCSLEKRSTDYYESMVSLAEKHNAKVGFAVICDDEIFEYNGYQPFPLLSVYKIAVAKCVLEKLEKKALTLDYKIHVVKANLPANTYSPILTDFEEEQFDISIRQLIEYALVKSDNNACDLLIDFAGGIKKVKKSVSKDTKDFKLKDQFDLTETEDSMHQDLSFCYNNYATPVFMCRYFEKCIHAENISKIKLDFFNQCLMGLETGTNRIQKGLPEKTPFAHKTGTGPKLEDGLKIACNDAGDFYLPNGKECYICIFIKDSYETDEADSALMQKIAAASYNYFKY